MMAYEIKRAKQCWTPELMKSLSGRVQHQTGSRVRWNSLLDTYMTYRVPYNPLQRPHISMSLKKLSSIDKE